MVARLLFKVAAFSALMSVASCTRGNAQSGGIFLQLGPNTHIAQPEKSKPGCETLANGGLSVSPSGDFIATRLRGVGDREREFSGQGGLSLSLNDGLGMAASAMQPIGWEAKNDRLILRSTAGGWAVFERNQIEPSSFEKIKLPDVAPFRFEQGFAFFRDADGLGATSVAPDGAVRHHTTRAMIEDAGTSCHLTGRCDAYLEIEEPWPRASGFDPSLPVRRIARLVGNQATHSFSMTGVNPDFVWVDSEQGVALAIAAIGDVRGLYRINRSGDVSRLSIGPLDKDVASAVFFPRSRKLAVRFEVLPQTYWILLDNAYRAAGGVANATLNLPVGAPSADVEVWETRIEGVSAKLQIANASTATRRESKISCSALPIMLGSPIQGIGRSGNRVYGYRFASAAGAIARGNVVYFIGGPGLPFDGIADSIVLGLVAKGYNVIVPAGIGSVGYGTQFANAGFGQEYLKAAADGVDLASGYVEGQENSTKIPIFVIGQSWGAQLAISALADPLNTVAGGAIVLGLCNADELSREFARTNTRLWYNATARGFQFALIYGYKGGEGSWSWDAARRPQSMCNSRLPVGRKVLVVHGDTDQQAPLSSMKKWATLNPEQVEMIIERGTGHTLSRIQEERFLDEAERLWW
jgi:pimeloyl-ACP methyl ester carboxylesterase